MKNNHVQNKNIYSEMGLSQVPRFLSTMDRNPLSPTYGCANREYWLARAVDFPSSIAQYGILGLSLVYSNPFENNMFYNHPKIAKWIVAGMEYLTKIQHKDGSFDEFYPNERGWAGPTGFLLHSMVHAWKAVHTKIPPELKDKITTTMLKAAEFLGNNDEIGVLANHHAMALLPLRETIELFGINHLEPLYEERKKVFLSYCNKEGWCLEYDGVDPGYLSATVSFIARLNQAKYDPELDEVAKKAIEFTKYFVYPNHHYGGTLGSRETFHFYPHGYELYGEKYPIALAQAKHMLTGFQKGASVYPALQADRYFVYRIPEFLFAARDFVSRDNKILPPLPWQTKEDNSFYFRESGIWGGKKGNYYTIANLARGGVVKQFKINEDGTSGKLIASDCGISGILENGQVFTSAWINQEPDFDNFGMESNVKTPVLLLNSQTFDPVKMSLFRMGMMTLGWHHKSAYHLKGAIRKVLMLRNSTLPITLNRSLISTANGLKIKDVITAKKNIPVKKLIIGEELPMRYVPQSRYFQPDELDTSGRELTKTELNILKQEGKLVIERFLS